MKSRPWDTDNESKNLLLNTRAACKAFNLKITHVERKVGIGSGYVIMAIKRNSSVGVCIAARIADQLGFTVDEMIKPPEEFQRLLDEFKTEGDN